MRRKHWHRINYQGPDKRRFASAFDAAAALHDATIDEWTAARIGQHEGHGQSPLYHYTSGAGFAGIMASGRFWATHIRDFDDETELRHAFGIASELVEAALERTTSRNGRAMLAGARTALNAFEDHFGVYVVSLCESCDIDNMWQQFADNDRGFALEIVPIGDPEQSPTREDKPLIVCRKVIYDEGHQRELFKATIDRITRDVEALERMYGAYGVRHAGKRFSLLLFHLLFDYSAAFKRKQPYAKEREWRYLYVVPRDSEAAHAERSRQRGGKTVRYMELDLWSQRHGDLKVQRVLGGLDCSKDQIEAAIEQIAKAGREAMLFETRSAARKD